MELSRLDKEAALVLWFLVCVGFVHFSRDATCLVFCACRCRSGQTQATVLTPTCGPPAGAPALPGERRRSPQEGVLPRRAVRTSAPQGVAPAAGLMPPGDPLAPGQPRTGGGLTWLGSRGTPGRNAALPARRPTLQLEGAPRVGREPGSVGAPQGFSVSGWFWTCQSVAPHRDLPGGAGLSRPPARTAGRCGLGPPGLSAPTGHTAGSSRAVSSAPVRSPACSPWAISISTGDTRRLLGRAEAAPPLGRGMWGGRCASQPLRPRPETSLRPLRVRAGCRGASSFESGSPSPQGCCPGPREAGRGRSSRVSLRCPTRP